MKGGIIFISLCSKQTCILLWKVMLPLPSKAVPNMSILEEIVQSQGSWCICFKEVQKPSWSMESRCYNTAYFSETILINYPLLSYTLELFPS